MIIEDYEKQVKVYPTKLILSPFFLSEMPTCAILGCYNCHKKTKARPDPEKHQSFQIPKSDPLRSIWLEKINKQEPYDGSVRDLYIAIKPGSEDWVTLRFLQNLGKLCKHFSNEKKNFQKTENVFF